MLDHTLSLSSRCRRSSAAARASGGRARLSSTRASPEMTVFDVLEGRVTNDAGDGNELAVGEAATDLDAGSEVASASSFLLMSVIERINSAIGDLRC